MKSEAGMTLIVKTVVRLMIPVMLLVAAYIVLHGQITHGGGFQSGVLVACAFLLLILAYGIDYVEAKVSFSFGQVFRSLGALLIILAALVGMLYGFWLFKNVGVYPYGVPGRVFSAGSLLIYNIGEMANVSASFLIALYFLVKSGRRKGKG